MSEAQATWLGGTVGFVASLSVALLWHRFRKRKR